MMEIALVDAVAAVRDELVQAVARKGEPDVTFAVGEVQLEFTVELRQDVEAKTGFKAWVLSAEAGGSSGRSRGHRVSVTLHPRPRGGRGEVLIAGDQARDEGPGDVAGHLGR